ncbi:hypothetical protein [uncultured Maritimibacter sp.]|jgi:hypothetical protein|uniref:hypothetical protein n=1 Tax=uncultured Maritimibacter sp. TaxID=991866 RepID=UPI00262155C8|nr:hypothetical protein [uncultured Maritimibacter sp.]
MYYDFDIHVPGSGAAPHDSEAPRDYVALFRDPEVVAALNGASETVRAFFAASGFGMAQGRSGLPPGYYPAADDDLMADVTQRIADNLSQFALKGENFNGFNLAEFARALAEAEPLPHEDTDGVASDGERAELPPATISEPGWAKTIASTVFQVGIVILLFAIGKGVWTAIG